MTWSEAIAELALDPAAPSPTADELRRRYLRGVRQRRPEVDPQGFQRLREAYEYLLARLPREAPVLPIASPSTPAPPAISAPVVTPPIVSEPTPALPAVAEPVSAEPVSAEPVSAEPVSAEPVSAEPFAEPPEPNEPPTRFARLRHALAVSSLPVSPPPPVAEVLQEILCLLSDGLSQSPGELADDLRRCLAQRGDESILLRHPLATRWLLVSELVAAASSLPSEAISSIGRAIEAGDLEQAKPRLALYFSIHPEAGPSIAAVLDRHAPTLAAALNRFLTSRSARAAAQGSPWRLLVFILLAVGNISHLLSGSSQHDLVKPPARSQAAGALRAAQTLGRQQDPAVAELARQLVKHASSEGLAPLSQTAYQLADQAETHRCDTVLVLRDNLLREVQHLEPPQRERYQAEYAVLDGKITEACPEMRLQSDELDKWGQQ